jgi:hypothetical protein
MRRGEIGARFIVPIDLDLCEIRPVDSEAVLARLLVQRADARGAGRYGHEQELRQQIRATLPMRKLES